MTVHETTLNKMTVDDMTAEKMQYSKWLMEWQHTKWQLQKWHAALKPSPVCIVTNIQLTFVSFKWNGAKKCWIIDC